MPSPRSLRREADALERRAAELARRAQVLRDAALALEAADGTASPRPSSRGGATLDGTMTSPAMPATLRRPPARPAATPGEVQRRLGNARARASGHPFPQAVIASGRTVAGWAADHGLRPDEVRTWYGTGRKGRPIPRQWAEAIEREFAIPASAWPRGVKG